MPLQTGNVTMLGLGVSNDTPPQNSDQPPLVDGVHLRWAFPPEKEGFPWGGFYLFRRPHREARPIFFPITNPSWREYFGYFYPTPFGRIESANPLHLSDNFPPHGSPEFGLEGGQLIVNFNEVVRWVGLRIGFFTGDRAIRVVAFFRTGPVLETTIQGHPGQIVHKALAFDAITAVRIGPGPAALVDVGFVPVSQDWQEGWEPVPNCPQPICLPVRHPNYPGTGGQPEDLTESRSTSANRVLYGSPGSFINLPAKGSYSDGFVNLTMGSPIVKGIGTKWDENFSGSILQVKGEPTAYLILRVLDDERLVLSRAYEGTSASSAAYSISPDQYAQLHSMLVHLVRPGLGSAIKMAEIAIPEVIEQGGPLTLTGSMVSVAKNTRIVEGHNTNWTPDLIGLDLVIIPPVQYTMPGQPPAERKLKRYKIIKLDSPQQRLTIDRPARITYSKVDYQIVCGMEADRADGDRKPRLKGIKPMDQVLLASLNPAVAQMLGLYWVDQTPGPGIAYDYLVLADFKGVYLNWDPLGIIGESTLSDVQGYIVFNKKKQITPSLKPPDKPKVYALPDRKEAGNGYAANAAGLVWDHGVLYETLLPRKPVMFHIWKASLGNEQQPGPEVNIELLTKNKPILITRSDSSPNTQERPSNWPNFPLNAIDGGLPEGWYSYRVSGIDIFGRHSVPSYRASWCKWSSAEPTPWYYGIGKGEVVHGSAVRLLNKLPPSPPTGVEAYVLDPKDPFLLKDSPYQAWLASLSDEDKKALVGLRVKWLWTPSQALQAPDVREFRIYFSTERMNSFIGKVTKVVSSNTPTSSVELELENSPKFPKDALKGAQLRVDAEVFDILNNEPGTPQKLVVKNRPSVTRWSTSLPSATRGIGSKGMATDILGSLRDREIVFTVWKPPKSNYECTLVIPPPYSFGKVIAKKGKTVVEGKDTAWQESLVGRHLKVFRDPNVYKIAGVDAKTQKLTLASPIQEKSAGSCRYEIRHPLAIDYSKPAEWEKRIHVVAYDEHVKPAIRPAQDEAGNMLRGDQETDQAEIKGNTITLLNQSLDLPEILAEDNPAFPVRLYLEKDMSSASRLFKIVSVDRSKREITVDAPPNVTGSTTSWAIGLPIRQYEVFLTIPKGSLNPSLDNATVYGFVGVTAADNKKHAMDHPKWGDPKRYGNESDVGGPVQIFRVLRESPKRPEPIPEDVERVYASRADYHGQSFYTYRWIPSQYLRTHVYRALDDSLFKTDCALRPRKRPLDPSNSDHRKRFFPPEWDKVRCETVSNELNQLDSISDKEEIIQQYPNLRNDSLRVLAGLPGNEAAFTQITIQPLDPYEPDSENPEECKWRDRIGPDSDRKYKRNKELRAYIDTLDGRSENRYFYRCAYVDGAQNRSENLSLSSPPVWLPNVVPPRAPVITRILAGDRQITLRWASNRKPDLREYRVYRADSKEAARDLRLITLVHTKPVPGDPAARPAEVTWIDKPLPGLTTFYYRVVAVDEADNVSTPSPVRAARTFDDARPEPPLWAPPVPGPEPDSLVLSWTSPIADLACLVQRSPTGSNTWTNFRGWLARGMYAFTDNTRASGETYDYRLRVLDKQGRQNRTFNILTT